MEAAFERVAVGVVRPPPPPHLQVESEKADQWSYYGNLTECWEEQK